MGFLIFLLAYVLVFPMTLINYFNVDKKGYFLNSAENIDRFANREYRATWNKWFRTEKGRKFGKIEETISLVLGYNQYDNTLTNKGWVLVYILDTIQKNHCLIAAGLPYDKDCEKLIITKIKKLYLNIKVYFISLFL